MGSGCSYPKIGRNGNNKQQNNNNDTITTQVRQNTQDFDQSKTQIGAVLFQNLQNIYPEKQKLYQTNRWRAKLSKYQGKKQKEEIQNLDNNVQLFLKNDEEDQLYLFKKICPQEYLNTLKYLCPPLKSRWRIWKFRVFILQNYDHELFNKLLIPKSLHHDQIVKDTSRTFPEYSYFDKIDNHSQGQDTLQRVLIAISNFYPETGYSQGMNFVVGFLLLLNGGNENEAFWLFIELARHPDYFLMGFYEKGFPLIEFLIHIAKEMLEDQHPDLLQHFADEGITEYQWIFQWFLSLYIYSFPLEVVLRFWDFILATDIFSLIKIALVLVDTRKEMIMKMDTGEISQMFNSLKSDTDTFLNPECPDYIDIEELLKRASDIEIKKISEYAKGFCQKNQDYRNNIYLEYFKSYQKNDKNCKKIQGEILKRKQTSDQQLATHSSQLNDNKIIQQQQQQQQQESVQDSDASNNIQVIQKKTSFVEQVQNQRPQRWSKTKDTSREIENNSADYNKFNSVQELNSSKRQRIGSLNISNDSGQEQTDNNNNASIKRGGSKILRSKKSKNKFSLTNSNRPRISSPKIQPFIEQSQQQQNSPQTNRNSIICFSDAEDGQKTQRNSKNSQIISQSNFKQYRNDYDNNSEEEKQDLELDGEFVRQKSNKFNLNDSQIIEKDNEISVLNSKCSIEEKDQKQDINEFNNLDKSLDNIENISLDLQNKKVFYKNQQDSDTCDNQYESTNNKSVLNEEVQY